MLVNIYVNPKLQYQTFEGIGASGAWWAQVVGGWDHIDSESGKSVRDRISELLYSEKNGIGMQVYRYNLGGGSKNSGKGKFASPSRMAESFDINGTEYDWNRDANAVYMMKQAVKDGAKDVIFFVNSPPERLTKNGKSHLDKLLHENLHKKNYRAFAKYCFDVIEHFLEEGIPVKHLSPINEPLWVWIGGQEGNHYRPRNAGKALKVFADEIEKRPKLKNLKFAGVENGDIRWFNKSYTRNLLRHKSVRRRIDSVDFHSYCLPAPGPLKILNNRLAYVKRYRKWMDKHYPDMSLKMSEWTHMKGGRDIGMDSALEMAKVMYEDISILNVVSWQHWIAVSEYDYRDGLIYINLEDKTFEITKRLFATGNFSKFIKPGFIRIDVKSDDKDLQVLAFEKDSELVVILINQSCATKNISFSGINAQKAKMYITDYKNDLAEREVDGLFNIKISSRSVSTIVL